MTAAREAPAAIEGRPPIWPLLLFATTVAFLTIPIAIGSSGARLGAIGGLVGMVVAFLLGVRRVRRVEHGDDTTPPSFLALARESTAPAGRMFIYVAGYLLLVFVVSAYATPSEASVSGFFIATGAAGLLIAGILDGARLQQRKDGVERQIFLQSTSLAFFITVLGAVSYALFEVFVGAPRLSMWLLWGWGMAAWAIGSVVIARRAT